MTAMDERAGWIVALEERAEATRLRIAETVEADRALEREKQAALTWCRANGNPHIPPEHDYIDIPRLTLGKQEEM